MYKIPIQNINKKLHFIVITSLRKVLLKGAVIL